MSHLRHNGVSKTDKQQATKGPKSLQWGSTLRQKWVVRITPLKHPPHNTTSSWSEYNHTQSKLYWEEMFYNRTRANHSALYADNNFLKKSQMLSDLIKHPTRHHSFTTVVVISSIFLFFTMTITAAVIVFCKKKNSVFALQKSEQDDEADYEMEELNTDIEYTETDMESDSGETSSGRHRTFQHVEQGHGDSTARCPLVPSRPQAAGEAGSQAAGGGPRMCQCVQDPRGSYQRMVATAIMERAPLTSGAVEAGGGASDSDESVSDMKATHRLHILNSKRYYSLPDKDDTNPHFNDNKISSAVHKPPRSVTYADQPPSYDSIKYASSHGDSPHRIAVSTNNDHDKNCTEPKQRLLLSPSHTDTKLPCVLYVNLPSCEEKKEKVPWDDCILYVNVNEDISKEMYSSQASGGDEGYTAGAEQQVVDLHPARSVSPRGPRRSMSVTEHLAAHTRLCEQPGRYSVCPDQPQSCPQSPAEEATVIHLPYQPDVGARQPAMPRPSTLLSSISSLQDQFGRVPPSPRHAAHHWQHPSIPPSPSDRSSQGAVPLFPASPTSVSPFPLSPEGRPWTPFDAHISPPMSHSLLNGNNNNNNSNNSNNSNNTSVEVGGDEEGSDDSLVAGSPMEVADSTGPSDGEDVVAAHSPSSPDGEDDRMPTPEPTLCTHKTQEVVAPGPDDVTNHNVPTESNSKWI